MTQDLGIRIDITLNMTGNPPGKLADWEMVFLAGPLAGMSLIGGGVWQKRERPSELSVTVPSRTFLSAGEKRNFNLLRITDTNAPPQDAPQEAKRTYYAPLDRMRRLVTDAYMNVAGASPEPQAAPEDEDSIPF